MANNYLTTADDVEDYRNGVRLAVEIIGLESSDSVVNLILERHGNNLPTAANQFCGWRRALDSSARAQAHQR